MLEEQRSGQDEPHQVNTDASNGCIRAAWSFVAFGRGREPLQASVRLNKAKPGDHLTKSARKGTAMNISDLAAWFTNVATSVCIIFVNKLLLGSQGYLFNFAVTLSGLHYLAAALLMQTYKCSGMMTANGTMPWKDRLIFTGVSSMSIISLNVSLQLNNVGFYQIAKLCVIPFVCIVEYLVYSRNFSHSIILSIALVILGVAVVTVSDVAVNWAGLNVAVLSIVAAGSQQLLCRHFQTALKITSNEMLLFTAWPMAALLLIIGPLMDWAITGGRWVFQYEYSAAVITVIMSSCALAIGVNLSQFACLGRFSAVAYQVMGHTKTVCVLLGGAAIFGDAISSRTGMGMSLAVAGMVGYGYFSSQEKAVEAPPSPRAAAAAEPEAVRLLGDSPAAGEARSANGEATGAVEGNGISFNRRTLAAATEMISVGKKP